MSILQIITPMYRKVRNFQDLINLNIRFIKGEIPGTVYHYGALAPDSQEQRASLIKLNELGFLTTDGQGPKPNLQHQQKVYVSGFMKQDLMKPFIKFIKRYPKVNYFISFKSQDIKTNIRNWKTEQEMVSPLTRRKKPYNWENITFTPFRNVYYDQVNNFEDFGNILYLFENEDYVYINIQLKSFCKGTHPIYCNKEYLNNVIIEFLSQGNFSFGNEAHLDHLNYLIHLKN